MPITPDAPFFSSRLGCISSIIISILGSLLLLLSCAGAAPPSNSQNLVDRWAIGGFRKSQSATNTPKIGIHTTKAKRRSFSDSPGEGFAFLAGQGRAVAGTVVEVAGKAFILSRDYGPVRSVMSAGKRGVRPACIRRPTAKGPSEVNRRGGPAVFAGRRLAALRHERRWISESISGVQRQ